MHPDICEILYTEEALARRVDELARGISICYQGKTPLLISLLKGSFVFMADLIRKLTCDCQVDFMAVSTYGDKSETTGVVRILKDLDKDIENLDILVVEDILDSGVTLSYIIKLLAARNPASLRLCTLFNKPSRRRVPVEVDFCGFDIPDAFVVGYGLDYAEKYRNLPYLGVLSPDCL